MGQPVGYPGGGLRLTQRCVVLAGNGNPNASATTDVQQAGLSSLYLQLDAAGVWICTTAAILPSGAQVLVPTVWQQITVP
jgi:hypothetical protein